MPPLPLLLLLLGTATSRCLHDETQTSVSLLRLPSSQPSSNFRPSSLSLPGSRDPQPLRIQTYYLGAPTSDGAWDPEGDGARWRLRALDAVQEASQRIQGVLAVAPVQGPLLLSRNPEHYCLAVWGDPGTPNYHRCSLLNPGYKGETCLGAKIPDAHLRGYALWPEQGPPHVVQPDGPGVQNTDFLLYVRVAHTSKCHQEPSIIAYAAYCQLDPEDRPVAGTIVYCAHHLTSPSLSHSDIVMATLHELLHALGFSGKLFKKWRDCPLGLNGNWEDRGRGLSKVNLRDSTCQTSLLPMPPGFLILSSCCLLPCVHSVTENCSTRQQVTRRDEWGQLLLITPAVSHSLAKHLGVPGISPGVPLEEEGPLSSHWEARLLQGSIMAATFDGAQRTRLDPITLAAFKDSGWYQVNHSAAEELLWGQGAGLEFGLVTTCGTGSSDFFCTGSGLGCHYLHLDKGRCSSDPMLEGCQMYKPLANSIPGYHGLLFCPRGRLCRTNRSTNAVTSPPVRLSTQDLLFQLSFGLAGPPGHSLGKEEREQLAETVLQALVSRGGTGRCHFHSPSITTSLVFTVRMWKPPGCQGPSADVLHRDLTLSLQKKPLEVYHGGTSFTTQCSKLPVTSDHYFSMTHLYLFTGLCSTLLILGGVLGTMAYQKRASLQVGPSTPSRPQELCGTRSPAEEIREVVPEA
ncbi:ciliated left-right organizer metallopeptidase isoform X3 [Oryctolagus cuniculus]|uniref:ciliated left-right organizer metallopeptidase isoform X3 n=1 Tax=Oryctolagus cuniculus TaxID=9986 RepID=UPI00387A5C41